MRRLLLSVGMLVFVGALTVGATGAFFSDTETSTGNTFSAGALDLQIDNSSYGFDYNDPSVDPEDATGEWGENENNSWELDDLTDQLFFEFEDLKPGDYGEDTISMHVQNDAWACTAFDLTGTPENEVNEPEAEVDDTDGADEGELQNYLSFIFWYDDGDNVLEQDEEVIDELSGLPGDIFSGEWLAIAEPDGDPLAAATTTYIGKGWCFGNIEEEAEPQSDYGAPTATTTGFACTGAEGDHNDAQTDGITVDVHFYAEQARNNDDFSCSNLEPPDGGDNGQREIVGAALNEYSAPECDVTVAEGESIQTAIDDAEAGDVICLGDGVHDDDTFPLHITTDDLTLAGENGPLNTASLAGGIFVDANDTTITGIEFTDFTSGIQASDNAAVYIHNEPGQGTGAALTGTTISYNVFTAPEGAKGDDAKAIMTEIGSGDAFASGIEIMHNEINGWNQGIFFNTANADVHHNDIYNNNVGIANDGPDNTTIHHNDFEDNDSEAVGVNPSATAGANTDGVLAVNTNNLAPDGGPASGNEVNWYGSDEFTNEDVDATGNWWDGEVEADRTNDTDEVDTSSPEASAFDEN